MLSHSRDSIQGHAGEQDEEEEEWKYGTEV